MRQESRALTSALEGSGWPVDFILRRTGYARFRTRGEPRDTIGGMYSTLTGTLTVDMFLSKGQEEFSGFLQVGMLELTHTYTQRMCISM